MLDDFFTGRKEGQRAKWSVEQLAEFRRRLLAVNRNHRIFATFYASQFDLPLADYLEQIDVVTLWNGKPEDLVNLESHMKRAERAAPKAKKMLGCYVVDYRRKQGIPVELMKLQCETGLRWLRDGRIERNHLLRQHHDGPRLRIGRLDPPLDRAALVVSGR